MKLPLSIVAACLTIAARGQSELSSAPINAAPTGKPRQEIEFQSPRAPHTNQISTNFLSRYKNAKDPKEPSVSYGGLATDIRKSTNRWKMFSLRRPANLKQDDANMIRQVRTEGGPAVKLFSVDF